MLNLLIIAILIFVALRLIPGKQWILHLPVYMVLQTTVLLAALLVLKMWNSAIFSPTDWAIISLSLIVIIWQSAEFLPFLRISSFTVPPCHEAHERDLLSILVLNVLISNKKYTELIRMVQNQSPDVVGLLETDSKWIDHIKSGLNEEIYPHRIVISREDGYGMCLFSKFPVKAKKVFKIYNSTPALYFTLSFKEKMLNGFLLHPKPPILPEARSTQPKDKEFDQLGDFIGSLPSEEAVMVFGDLNDVAWSRATQNFLIDSGLKDARRGRGIKPTFPTWAPFLGFPLDQIFVNENFRMHEMKVLPDIGSDHYPLLVRLCLKGMSS